MGKLNYSNEIAPKIIEEARKRIFKTVFDKGYINKDSDTIDSIEEQNIAICSSISMKVTGYFVKNDPEHVNSHAPVYSSLLTVLVGMELTRQLCNGNNESPEIIFDELIDSSPIETFDEFLLERIGLEYKSKEFEQLAICVNQAYIDNWIFIHEEANRKGLRNQILFVVDSLMIMLSIGIQIEKKRLGIS